jgi:hypothetical protein
VERPTRSGRSGHWRLRLNGQGLSPSVGIAESQQRRAAMLAAGVRLLRYDSPDTAELVVYDPAAVEVAGLSSARDVLEHLLPAPPQRPPSRAASPSEEYTCQRIYHDPRPTPSPPQQLTRRSRSVCFGWPCSPRGWNCLAGTLQCYQFCFVG